MSGEVGELQEDREAEEGSLWPAVIGLNTAALIAGLLMLIKGFMVDVGLALILYYLAVLVAFIIKEVKAWPHVVASFFNRLKETPIPAEPEKVGAVGFPTAIFLLTEAALFAAAFGAYFLVRSTFPTWPPPGAPYLDGFIPRIQTAFLLLSSLMIEWAVWSVRRGRNDHAFIGIVATALLGAAFLVAKLGFEWPHLIFDLGFTPASGFYGSSFYILLGAHGAHVLGGVIVLTIVAGRARMGQFTPSNHGLLEATSIYWHFVHLVWLLLFAIIYEGGFGPAWGTAAVY